MSYRVIVVPAAQRELKKLRKKASKKDLRAIIEAIDGLSDEPRPPNVEKLSASDSIYRVRRGNFRLVYQVRDSELLVAVVKVGDRKDSYDRILKLSRQRLTEIVSDARRE
jgi:mRNA interferase RelE/StbE